MAAETVCNDILNRIKDSKLNFILSETPYSVHLTIRKSFAIKIPQKPLHVKDSQISTSDNFGKMKEQLQFLNNQLDEKTEQYNKVSEELDGIKVSLAVSRSNTEILESKIDKVEREALDVMHQSKVREIEKVEVIKELEGVVKQVRGSYIDA